MKTLTTTAAANRRQAEALAARLHTPAGEILDMVTAAALEAVTAALDSQGSITLPLILSVAQDAAQAVSLPAPMAAKLRELATAAGIAGGADSFAAALIGDILNDTAADILIDGWEITDPATIAELYRIQSGTAEILPFPNCSPQVIGRPETTTAKRPATIQQRPFIVTTEWAEVTIPISKRDAEWIDSRNPAFGDSIASHVHDLAFETRRALDSGRNVETYRRMIAQAGRLPKRRTRPFAFRLELAAWEFVTTTAARIDASPEQFARAAIAKRVSQSRIFVANRTMAETTATV